MDSSPEDEPTKIAYTIPRQLLVVENQFEENELSKLKETHPEEYERAMSPIQRLKRRLTRARLAKAAKKG